MSVRISGDSGLVETGDGAGSLVVAGSVSAGSENITGNQVIGGTFGVTGAARFLGGMYVSGSTSLTGAVVVGQTLVSTGAVNFIGGLTVSGSTSLTGAVAIGQTLAVTGVTNLLGNVVVGGTFGVSGASRCLAGLYASGSLEGVSPGKLLTTTLSGGTGTATDRVSADAPGFYFVHNQSTCTIAKASDYPGSEYVLSVYWGGNTHRCVVTASVRTEDRKINFVTPYGITGSATFGSEAGQGVRMLMAADGSVVLRSDGYYWLVCAASGALTMEN